ncbi:MAG: glycosyltransferase [Christensenellaceae bacterium]|jgi:glycosyltransferase involved in cell wall biosynthesis|nr:glycosyltransferase [Christensenellaceae bacterium]
MENKKLNILMAMDMYLPSMDGVIATMQNYLKCMKKMGHNVAAAAPGAGKNYKDTESYPIIRSRAIKLPFYGGYYGKPVGDKEFERKLDETKWDIIHMHSPFNMCKFMINYAKARNIPIVATFHTNFRPIMRKIIGPLAEIIIKNIGKRLSKLDEILVISGGVKKQAESFGVKNNITILRDRGTNLPKASDDLIEQYKQKINKEYGLKDDDTVFLFVGRLMKLKRIDFTMKALKILKDSGQSFKYFVAGEGMDEKYLKKTAKKLGLENDVIFTGFVEDFETFKALYARADLLLFPSLYDNFGLVKIEAAAHKTAGVFVRGSMAGYDVEHNVNGYLCEDDIQDIARVIKEAISNKELLKKVSQKAGEDHYITWQQSSELLIEKYLEILKNYKNKIEIPEEIEQD